MAMDKERVEIETEILNKLTGKIFLLQDITSKQEIIFQAFLEVYNSPKCQKFVRKSQGLELEVFFKEFLNYGLIEEFLEDIDVEDIMINYLAPIFVHKTKLGLVKTERRFESREEIDLFIKKLVVFSGRKEIKSVNNVELADIKGRANVVYSPFGPQITITRAKEKALSIVELIKTGCLIPELAAQFWLYVEGLGVKAANIMLAGGPGAGKTTLLNAIFSFIPENDRIVIIEDTLELNTNAEENISRLESNEENSLADLVKNSLRMRPDRIVVGEVRGKEAQDMMTAMNIGKYCMGTMHASTARETIMRLQHEPMNVNEVLVNLIDVFVIMRRYNVNGKVIRVVGELVETAGLEKDMVLLSPLWHYDYNSVCFKQTAVSSVFRDRLSQISGKTPKDISDELTLRTAVIKSLVQRNIVDIEEVTKNCRQYIVNPDETLLNLGINKRDVLK